MSPTLDSMLIGVATLAIMVLMLLFIFLLRKAFDWSSGAQKVEIVGTQKVKHEGELTAADNIYTKLAAEQHAEAASKNLKAQELALERAKIEERTEQARHENALHEIAQRNSGSA